MHCRVGVGGGRIINNRGQVAEANETNNTLPVPLTCAVQPDLVIDNYKLSGTTIFYRISNVGQAPASPSWTRLRIDGTMVAESSVGSLAPGEGRWINFVYTYIFTPPNDTIEIVADGRGQVTESNETNNTRLVSRGRLLGDVNNDTKIDSGDALLVAKQLVGTRILTGDDFIAGDVNDDKAINSADLLFIKKYLVGTLAQFPGGIYIP